MLTICRCLGMQADSIQDPTAKTACGHTAAEKKNAANREMETPVYLPI